MIIGRRVLLQIWYITFQMISWFIDKITNICSRFGLILEIHRHNLQNGKQYSVWKIYI